jgi:hypothetical protein
LLYMPIKSSVDNFFILLVIEFPSLLCSCACESGGLICLVSARRFKYLLFNHILIQISTAKANNKKNTFAISLPKIVVVLFVAVVLIVIVEVVVNDAVGDMVVLLLLLSKLVIESFIVVAACIIS